MMQTELTQRPIAQVGEAISHELGAQMITDYQAANPADVKSYHIGRNIMEQILAQPGCAGIRFYNAYNEIGGKTLVYIGVDESGKSLVSHTLVNNDGSLNTQKAIVADRAGTSTGTGTGDAFDEAITWLSEVFF